MGKRGPAPKPTKLKLAQGNPGKRPLNESEPEAITGQPPMPDEMGETQRAVWDQVTASLQSMDLLAETDAGPIERYSRLLVLWRKLMAFIEKHGETYPVKEADGRVKMIRPLPQVAQLQAITTQLLRLEQEFGLTPSSRTRIRVDMQGRHDDPLDALLKRMNG